MTETLSGVAALALTGFFIAFGLLMLFMALIQPIWCVIDCAIDDKRGTASKVIWIIALILLYGLANWFYGAFAAGSKLLRRLTRLAWIFAIVLIVAFAVLFYMHAEFRRGIQDEWKRREFIVQDIAPQRVNRVQAAVDPLRPAWLMMPAR
jgi:small-conductance mechanosensitive channel